MKMPVLLAAVATILSAQPLAAETLRVRVERAEAGSDMVTKAPIVTLELAPDSRAAFGEFTRARVGEQVRLRLGETVLSEPIIREPIAGGTLVINGQFTDQSARELADSIMKAGAVFEVDGSDK